MSENKGGGLFDLFDALTKAKEALPDALEELGEKGSALGKMLGSSGGAKQKFPDVRVRWATVKREGSDVAELSDVIFCTDVSAEFEAPQAGDSFVDVIYTAKKP
jgi:hypothetical protein